MLLSYVLACSLDESLSVDLVKVVVDVYYCTIVHVIRLLGVRPTRFPFFIQTVPNTWARIHSSSSLEGFSDDENARIPPIIVSTHPVQTKWLP